MLAYAGYNRLPRERVNLTALVEETADLLRHAVGAKADLQLALDRALPPVAADPAQLRQVLLNLVTNAAEALQGRSGTVLVRTQQVEADRERLRSPFCQEELPEGLYVLFQVADNGCGMDELTVGRIFDPFFTTKFQGRGLGLAAVLGIIRGHRGVIQVHSLPSRGTTVEVLLPAVPQ
jgi:signal transduction histidine kinase